MNATTLSATTIDLRDGDAATAHLHVAGVAPGDRGGQTVTVRYRDDVDSVVALYAGAPGNEPSALARQIRIGVFERCPGLLPFPVFTGTLADLARHTDFTTGVGRWTGRGDGDEHEVVYEVTWRLPREAHVPAGCEADLDLTFAARH